ncbi:hypothetical protein AB6A40_008694 [Gnathostoma spinigerum]|uniref:Uncharacterized protein n=1 Tax=Gnathostoma spinigerum TaxID=75299 RepID=A0ABD6ER16_9BILA
MHPISTEIPEGFAGLRVLHYALINLLIISIIIISSNPCCKRKAKANEVDIDAVLPPEPASEMTKQKAPNTNDTAGDAAARPEKTGVKKEHDEKHIENESPKGSSI